MPPARTRRRNFLYSLILLGCSLLVAFGLCEVILRILGYRGSPRSLIRNVYPVDDPILDWRRIPNSQYVEGRIVYKYNDRGFRDVNRRVENPLRKPRIVVLGDSVTEGYGVKDGSFFAAYIESNLGGSHEVVNIAAGGLNTPQEAHLFMLEGVQYRPKLLVLNLTLNDCDFYSNYRAGLRHADDRESRIDLLNLSVTPGFKSFLKSSALLFFVKTKIEHISGLLKGGPKTDYYTALWSKPENRQKIQTGFGQLAALRQEHGFEVVVMIWPVLADYQQYRFGEVHQWIQKEAGSRGFAVIDLLPRFSKVSYRDLQVTSEDNVHPNDRGHKIAADAFLAWFRTQSSL